MPTHTEMMELHRAVSRIIAHLAGSDPLLVWPSYRTFEDDIDILVGVLEHIGDSAKPFLEMRERAREAKANATSPTASRVVGTTSSDSLDDEGTE